jgi:segregation and condensation protein A
LRAHLLEYKLAKEIARYLRQREEAGLQTHGRSGLLAGIEAQLTWSPPTLIGLEVDMLAQAFQRILELRARDEAASATMLPLARVRVSERITEIVSILRERPLLSLAELLENESSRLVIIVTFLAVLELWKHARIAVMQSGLFSPIVLERGERWEDEGQIAIEDEY